MRRTATMPPMSDEYLRELERLWKASGSAEDEAAYRAAGARVEELDPLRTRLMDP